MHYKLCQSKWFFGDASAAGQGALPGAVGAQKLRLFRPKVALFVCPVGAANTATVERKGPEWGAFERFYSEENPPKGGFPNVFYTPEGHPQGPRGSPLAPAWGAGQGLPLGHRQVPSGTGTPVPSLAPLVPVGTNGGSLWAYRWLRQRAQRESALDRAT